MHDLDGSTALVTGASRGLGLHIASALAAQGVAVGLVARSAEDLQRAAEGIRNEHDVSTAVVPADLTDAEALGSAAHRVTTELGPVDVLVNNAGVMAPRPYHLRNPADIEDGVRLNLVAPLLLTRQLLHGMLERDRGHVVNISSVAGKVGPPNEAIYGATKAGLIGFTQSLRRELYGTGVGASVICPGYVSGTGMYADAVERTGRPAPAMAGRATPDDVAEAVIRAIRKDVPELFVNSMPTHILTVLSEASPRFAEWLTRTLGLFRPFEQDVGRVRRRGSVSDRSETGTNGRP